MKHKLTIGFVLGMVLCVCIAGYIPQMHLITVNPTSAASTVAIQPSTNDGNTVLELFGSNAVDVVGQAIQFCVANPAPDINNPSASIKWTIDNTGALLNNASTSTRLNADGSWQASLGGISGDLNSNLVCYTVMEKALRAFQAADATTSSTLLTANNLLVGLTAGKKYSFVCCMYLADSVAAEGVKIDFAQGTAAFTSIRMHVLGTDTGTALNPSLQLLSIAAVCGSSTFTGSGMYLIHGTMEPSSSGTFGPRFAQNSHTSGTATLARGSYLEVSLMQ